MQTDFLFFLDNASPDEFQPDVFAVRASAEPQKQYESIGQATANRYVGGWRVDRSDLLSFCEPISEAEARQMRPALFERLAHE